MRLNVRSFSRRWALRVQQLYARAILSGPPPKRGGVPGGSLSSRVLDASLISFRRWGFVFSPGKLGAKLRFWWKGTRRQGGRGRTVSLNEAQVAEDLRRELLAQIRRADRS